MGCEISSTVLSLRLNELHTHMLRLTDIQIYICTVISLIRIVMEVKPLHTKIIVQLYKKIGLIHNEIH